MNTVQNNQINANAIRALSMDAVQQANSGHPGAPMGMADIAEVLWNEFLNHNPRNPNWVNRDRFILSNGHGSMLLYSLLHLSGYDLSMDDIKQFRQLHSKTPGHPEYGYTPGVETTTGPLGQGFANAVGMALAEKVLAAQFNRPSLDIIDHYTYVFLGDGCLMEGISHEVASLAGTHQLNKLIAFYDDNNISIDGQVEGWFTDNTPHRFRAYGWHVIEQVDGHDSASIRAAITRARTSDKPVLICCQTIIGKGAPNKQGDSSVHGAPLGADEIASTRENLNWPHPPFSIDSNIYTAWDATEKGNQLEQQWNQLFIEYQNSEPELANDLSRRLQQQLPDNFITESNLFIHDCQQQMTTEASRKSSQNCLNFFGSLLPELIGGSADLAGSNLTIRKDSKTISANDASGNYIYYGVREFGMSAIMNGIALHGGFINYGATFLVFMEYARNAIRMAAIMKQQSIFVFTHDSIGLGEDGPTHQPIEQLANLRMTPGLHTWRPCDSVESAVSWQQAILYQGPSALIFSRQGLPCQSRTQQQLFDIAKGGYILTQTSKQVDVILIATGSEIELAVSSMSALLEQGIHTRVISMPCCAVFNQQSSTYQESVLPSAITKRIAIEASHVDGWHKYVGLQGAVIGMSSFGESAPANHLMNHFGFTTEHVVEVVKGL